MDGWENMGKSGEEDNTEKSEEEDNLEKSGEEDDNVGKSGDGGNEKGGGVYNATPFSFPPNTTPSGRPLRSCASTYKIAAAPDLALAVFAPNVPPMIPVASVPIPTSLNAALNSHHRDAWMSAIDSEINGLVKDNTWTECAPPNHPYSIYSHFRFSVKSSDGWITRFKARLVAGGNMQVYGLNYTESYTPVVLSSTLLVMISICAANDWPMTQGDIRQAFVKAELEEDVTIILPRLDPSEPTRYAKLNKSLYGLKQAGRNWFILLTDYLGSIGMAPCDADPCLYLNGSRTLFLALHVDDMIAMGAGAGDLISDIVTHFGGEEMGDPDVYLGLKIVRNDDGVHISQPHYVHDLLVRFNLADANPVNTPVLVGHLSKGTLNENPLFRSMIGSAMFAATHTRPDIQYAVNSLSQFLTCPAHQHVTAAKRIIKYMGATLNHGLHFPSKRGGQLIGYSDSDWAGDEDRKSISGYVMLFNGAPISWKSQKQSTVALSSCEAEFIALAAAVAEILFLRQLLTATGFGCNDPTTLYVDNMGAIDMAKNGIARGRCKHVDIKYKFVKNHIDLGDVELMHIPSQSNLADVLTKPLPAPKFIVDRDSIVQAPQ
jgi:hypothetical protein